MPPASPIQPNNEIPSSTSEEITSKEASITAFNPEVQPQPTPEAVGQVSTPEVPTAVPEQPSNVIPFPKVEAPTEAVSPNDLESIEAGIEKNAGNLIKADTNILLKAEHAEPANLIEEMEKRRTEALAKAGYGAEDTQEKLDTAA